MKTAYLVRYGAFGDAIHMSNVFKALDELGYHITFEHNFKCGQVHARNPRIDRMIYLDPHARVARRDGKFKPYRDLAQRLRNIRKGGCFDLFIDFSYSLEHALIAPEAEPEYFWPLHMRRAKNANTCYYDQSMMWAGLTDKKYMGWTGEVWFSREEHRAIKEYLSKWQDHFIILWTLRGTMWQKAIYPIAKDICDEWLKRHPKSLIILTGDEFCQKWEWDHPNVLKKSARIPFRQALCMARYVDLVVTPETGLGVGAGIYSTPKIMMLTAASLKNIVGNDKNDFSLQSPAWCSPCTRAIYNTKSCTLNENTGLPICVDFPKDMVLDRMEEVYSKNFPRNWSEPEEGDVYI
jgi:ADP-heptose:LPS heptosyltransferase